MTLTLIHGGLSMSLQTGLCIFMTVASLSREIHWFAKDQLLEESTFLICFDFTSERFGPHLSMPYELYFEGTASLSSVKEEQLAVLFQRWDTLEIEIWITTKIEPNAVSWNSKVFLAVNMRSFTCFDFQILLTHASFFIDKEKKVAVVFDKNKERNVNPTRTVAYIVGVDGSLKEADLGEYGDKHCYPLVCSYVPSLVQLN
ncbi:hypothetical protein ARALYDRAFT_899044 [Arabidopsis lyrata subsp. lyrata]|uniref:F-box associated beta-propeller type 1 domain-containing protein n=1 Tax=Arabidopsis lyrata subsp. lyrata TaxID=81972 RepID=D7L555_ARALL|nr:hypothetical protein ARALYDRAFT_899044 [Arabidopsis lyrata subsp. lyrata]